MSGAPNLHVARLIARGVRNLAPLEIEPSPRLNVIHGDNGHGKTSLLEAVYLVATSKSFRAPRARDARTHETTELHVRARVSEARGDRSPILREQSITLFGTSTAVTIDGNRPQSLGEYATQSPVVVFHPDEIALSSGPAAGRRRMLDRVALYERPGDQPLAGEYARALKARQEILRRGDHESAELDAYEELAARSGALLTKSRARASEALAAKLRDAFAAIADPTLRLRAEFAPGGGDDVDEALRQLRDRRGRDARTPAATWGPHRDDLALYLDDRPARAVASQGQHRALTLALKAAEAAAVRDATGLEPIQLLDDVSSELDPSRTRSLFLFLRACHGQIFLSTTREDLIREHFPEATEQRSFRVVRGVVEASS